MGSDDVKLPVSDPPPRGEERLFKGSAMTKRGAYAALSYMSCAVLLVLFNKAALSSYSFPCANVITLFQMICSCSFLYALRRWKVISFNAGESLTITDSSSRFVPLKTLIHTLPLAFTYLLYMLATMESVRGVNVPMYTTLRRTTVVFTMFVEFLLVGQKYTTSIIGRDLRLLTATVQCRSLCLLAGIAVMVIQIHPSEERERAKERDLHFHAKELTKAFIQESEPNPCVVSVALIVLGAFIAGARDLSFDSYGYAVVFLSNITTAIYLATISRIGKSSGLNSFGLMWCNGVICGPVLLFWTYIRGDLEMTMNFPNLLSPGFLVVLLLSCILAFFLNYSIFLNTTLNSAVTQTICGNLKDLFTIALGWILFGGLPFDFLNIVGQLLGFFGSGLYAYYKLIGK